MAPRNHLEMFVRLAAPFLWALIMLWLSLTSSPPQISGVLGWDKLLHAGAYGLLTLLIAQFLLYSPLQSGKSWWQAGLVAVCYGALLEILQLMVNTGRTAEWGDLCADVVGAFLAYVVFRKFPGLGCSRHELHNQKQE